MKRFASSFVILVAACATIGDETAFPGAIESGVAAFRALTDAEVGAEQTEPGRIVPAGIAHDRAMQTPGDLWYAGAEALDEPPPRDDTLPPFEVDWARFAPRAIYRSAAAADVYGFQAGALVLEATEAWQGGEVFDPWAVVQDDGSIRLYFASVGGIGVAVASADGVFGAPMQILDDARSPSVVRFGGETWLFFERAGNIGLASSTDGLSFTVRSESLELGDRPRGMEDPGEVGQRSPGAVVVTSPTGRSSVRVYFESRWDDMTSSVSVSGTMDGVNFDRLPGEVFGEASILMSDAGQPAPFVADVGEPTILTATRAHAVGSVQFRAIVGAISPASVELVPSPPDP